MIRAAFRTIGPIAPRLMGRVAFWLWFRPRRGRESSQAGTVMRGAEQAWMRVGRKRCIRYAWGAPDSPRILLLHGWNGRASQMAAMVDPLVAAGYRVVALDAPAHGRSEGTSTDVFEICDALSQLQREEGVMFGVVAHSMGSLICAAALRAGALNAERTVCLSPAVRRDTLLQMFSATLALPDRVAADLARRVDGFAGPGFWEGAVIPVRTLIVHDSDDDFIPLEDSRFIAETWPAASLIATSGLGHFQILRDPAVAETAAGFFADSRGIGPSNRPGAITLAGVPIEELP